MRTKPTDLTVALKVNSLVAILSFAPVVCVCVCVCACLRAYMLPISSQLIATLCLYNT